MNSYVSANDTLRATDSGSIIAAIETAVSNGSMKVVIPRHNARTNTDLWVIEETVDLPSGIEILVDDAHLVLASGKYLNMFRAVAPHTEDGSTSADALRDITIRGEGRATLDGGEYNGLHEKNYRELGQDIYLNTTLLFFNVEGLRVENLSVINQRWWGITNVFVRGAQYRNIRFEADFSRIDKDGVHHPDEYPREYDEVYVKNADGIDLRIGCHDFLIENISGFTEDDSVALTALGTGEKKRGLFVTDADSDIHDVKIHRVVTDSYCANVRLLNGNGHKLYNIELDGIASLHSARRTADHGFDARNNSTVRIGDMAYTSDHPTVDDVKNITIRNVSSEASCAVTLCNGISDLVIENVTVHGGYAAIGTFRKYRAEHAEYYGATVKNASFSNINLACDGAVAVMSDHITFID